MVDQLTTATIIADALATEYVDCPLGLDEKCPRLSWKLRPAANHLSDRGLAQSAYQILASRDRNSLQRGDLWDSGKVISSESSFVEYKGLPLQSGERAWWAVRVYGLQGVRLIKTYAYDVEVELLSGQYEFVSKCASLPVSS